MARQISMCRANVKKLRVVACCGPEELPRDAILFCIVGRGRVVCVEETKRRVQAAAGGISRAYSLINLQGLCK